MLDYVHFQTLIDGLFIKLDPEKILFFDWLSFFTSTLICQDMWKR